MANEQGKKPIVYANANAHLDTVWNWTLEDTVKRHLVRTLKENFDLFEKYPNYRFNFEGAYRYELIKEYYPEDYERLKGYVADGKWFVTGSSWENGDVVVSDPEALMRNILYGNRYFEKEFGKKSNDIFLPDCFGFAYTLPTIMKHMGLKSFSSAKLIWNSGNKVPFSEGVWKGIDGSEVVAELSPGQYVTQIHHSWGQDEKLYDEVTNLPVAKRFLYYGVGDEGGAPTDGSAKFINDDVANPDTKLQIVSAYAGQYADELTEEEYKALPVFDGELLMTTHGVGSYTSVAPMKRFNRKNELLADLTERANVFASWLGVKNYPKEKIEELWKLFIRHEFHDDITGTSLQKVYTESFTDYITALNQWVSEFASAGENIAAQIDTSKLGRGIPLVVFNGVTAARKDVVTAEVTFPQGEAPQFVKVYNCDKKEVPSQVLEKNGNVVKIAFLADVMSDGYSTYLVTEAKEPCGVQTGLSVTENGMENNRYKVTLDETGNVASIFDKAHKKELLAAPIQYQVLDNSYVHWGAWEIWYKDVQRDPRSIVGGKPQIRIVENGPVQVALEVVRQDGVSSYTQVIRLSAEAAYVNVENNINWTEKSAFLKVAFPLTVSNEKAVYDAGLGTVARGNNEEMKYEVPVHKWANLADASQNYSVTILNDCKYAMDKPDNNTLRLTAIHTPQHAFLPGTRQDLQDMGENRFSYAIMGGTGDFRESLSAVEGEKYNQPLVAIQTTVHNGVLPTEYAFTSLNTKQAAIKAIKVAEDSNEIIVRVYEKYGQPAKNVSLWMAGGIVSAREVNGYEEHIGDVTVKDGSIVFDMEPYKPKTFALTLEACNLDFASPATYEAVSLPVNTKISSYNNQRGEYGFGEENVTIPAELLPDALTVGNVSYTLAKDADGVHQAVVANGETITLPAGATKLYVVAASLADDRDATFLVDGAAVNVPVQSFDSYIGGWDQYGSDHYGYIKEDTLVYSASHVHDKSGDKVYGKFCLFQYALDVAGAKTVTLPQGGDVLVVAATALVGEATESKLVTRMIDKKEKRIRRTLTVKNGSGSGSYVEGNPVSIIYQGNKTGSVIWQSSTGETYEGAAIEFAMPDKDFSLKPYVCEYDENLALGATVTASGAIAGCEASNAVDGNKDTMWKVLATKDNWIVLDLGKKKTIDTIVLKHAESLGEAQVLNTAKFCVQVFADGAWVTVDQTVARNRLAVTEHTFPSVCSQYVRIMITMPTRSESDKCARLGSVEVYNNSTVTLAEENTVTDAASVTPYDLIDCEDNSRVLFAGTVKSGEVIALDDTVLVQKWSVKGASAATLLVSEDGKSFVAADSGVLKAGDSITRILNGAKATCAKVVVESAANGSGGGAEDGVAYEVCVMGKSLTMTLHRQWKGTWAGTRHPHAVKHEAEGTMWLPAEDGAGHDVFGLETNVKAGPVQFYLCIQIPEEELAGAADDLALFRFDPGLPGGFVSGGDVTVADYKAAPVNEAGYRTISADFIMAADGGVEGRIVSYRKLSMTVSECGVYESKE